MLKRNAALRVLNESSEMTASRNSQRGLSLVEMLLVLLTLALLSVVFLPMLARSRVRNSKLGCTASLKQIGIAYLLYAGDHSDRYPFTLSGADGSFAFVNSPQVFRHYQIMSNELNTPKILVCPNDMKKTKATSFVSFSNTNVSYFVGLDADESKPERLLSGDRNMTGGTLSNGFLRLLTPATKAGWTKEIHRSGGNIGLADGSVKETDAPLLQQQLRTNRLAVIRLAIP
jgi:prepilin-type processing-associated H-X9-DG protein